MRGHVVAEGSDLAGLCLVAARALARLGALVGAGGSLGLSPLAPVVAELGDDPAVGLDLGRAVGVGEVLVAPVAAPVGGVAGLGAGGRHGRVRGHVVAEGRNLNISGLRCKQLIGEYCGVGSGTCSRAGRLICNLIGGVYSFGNHMPLCVCSASCASYGCGAGVASIRCGPTV